MFLVTRPVSKQRMQKVYVRNESFQNVAGRHGRNFTFLQGNNRRRNGADTFDDSPVYVAAQLSVPVLCLWPARPIVRSVPYPKT